MPSESAVSGSAETGESVDTVNPAKTVPPAVVHGTPPIPGPPLQLPWFQVAPVTPAPQVWPATYAPVPYASANPLPSCHACEIGSRSNRMVVAKTGGLGIDAVIRILAVCTVTRPARLALNGKRMS